MLLNKKCLTVVAFLSAVFSMQTQANKLNSVDVHWKPVTDKNIVDSRISQKNDKALVSFVVPSKTWLRVKSKETNDLRFSSAYTSGLSVDGTFEKPAKNTFLLHAEQVQRVVSIYSETQSLSDIEIHLGESHTTPLSQNYALLQANDASPIQVTQQPISKIKSVYQVESDDQPLVFNVEGLKQVRISSMVYANHYSQYPKSWNINAKLDGSVFQWQQTSSLKSKHYWFSDKNFWGTGFQYNYLAIPEGAKTLEVSTSNNVWLQIGKQDDNFLFASNQKFLSKADNLTVLTAEQSDAEVKTSIANIINSNNVSSSINQKLALLAKKHGEAQVKEQLHNLKFVGYRQLAPSSSSLKGKYVTSVPDAHKVASVHNILPAQHALPVANYSTKLFYQVKKGQSLHFKLPSDRLLPTVRLSLVNPEKTISYLQIDNEKSNGTIYLTTVKRESTTSSSSIHKKGQKKVITLDNVALRQNAYLDFSKKKSSTVEIHSESDEPILLALDYAFIRPHPSTEDDWLSVIKTSQTSTKGQSGATDYPLSITNEYKHLEALVINRVEQFSQSITKAQLHDLSKVDSTAIWQERISALKQLGLWQQYTVMLKGLVLHTDGELFSWSVKQLEAYYNSTGNLLALEQLWFSVFTRLNNKEASQKLAAVNFQQGQYKNVLMFALLNDTANQDLEIALWAASKLDYWQLYLQLSEALSPEKKAFYQGLHAWMTGDIEKASTLWSINEKAIRESESFRALFSLLDTTVEIPLTPAKGAIKSFDSYKSILVKSNKRETKQSLAIAAPDAPIKASIQGPVNLVLEMRQLKPTEGNTKADWLDIKLNNEHYVALINDGQFTSELQIDGSDKRLSSNNRRSLKLGEGIHHLSITPEQFETAVAVKVYQPALSELVYADLKQDCDLVNIWQIIENDQVFDACYSKLTTSPNKQTKQDSRFIFEDDALKAFNQAANALRKWKKSQNHNQLVTAHHIIANNRDNPLFQPLHSQLKRLTSWKLLQPTQSAGSQLVPLKKNKGLSEETKVLNALIPPLSDVSIGHELQAKKKLEILTEYRQKKQARLVFTYQSLPYMLLPKIAVNITLPNGKVRKAVMQNLRTQVYFELPAGEQSLEIVLPELYQHSKAFVVLEVKTNEGQWQAIEIDKKRRLFVANKQQPLKYYINAPAVLRVQSYDDNSDSSTRSYIQKEAGFFTIDKEHKVRVYQLALTEKEHTNKSVYYSLATTEQAVAGSYSPLTAKYDINTAGELKNNEVEASNDSLTYGAGYQWQQRFNFDEDDAQQTERFHQASISMRDYLSAQNMYWRGDFKFRMHHADHKVLATSQFVDWMLPNSNQRIFSRVDFHYQSSLDDQSSAWSGKATLGWHNQFDLNAALRNYIDISAFALAVDEGVNEDLYWDNDVLSKYKKDHLNGINISNRIRYQTFADWHVDARFDLRTNELSESLSADSASIGLSTNVYIRGADLALGYQRKHYFSDENRRESYERNRFTIRLQKRWWQSFSDLWHANASINYDDALDEPSFNIGVSWNNTNNSVLDDFRKNEIRFRSLFKQQHNLVDYIEGSTQ